MAWAIIEKWKRSARELQTQTYALYFAMKDPRVPWYAKGLAAFVLAYAVSPIDLIPDFVPVIGYLDDLILVPLGIAITIKLIPPEVWFECREKAGKTTAPTQLISWMGAAFIITAWILLGVFILRLFVE